MSTGPGSSSVSIMKGKVYYFFITLCGIILLANAGNPPNGYTGAPGDGICSNCHSPGSGIDGSVTISGLPSSLSANTTYTITVTVENVNGASKGGFQLVALDQNNNNIGTFSNAGASSTLQTSGGRTYWEHNPAKSFSGPGTLTYTVDWKSPTTAGGQTITMYAASILTNGNGNSSGDVTKQDQVSGTMPGPPALNASISAFKNITCNGGSDGSITVTATNGLPPYNYLWSDGQTTATAIGLNAKLYSVTVTDNASGNIILSKLLTEPSAINIATTGKKTLNCNGDKDGSITINSSGGTGIHRYQWNTGATTKTISNLQAGTYTVTVIDNSNCALSETFEITQPDALALEFSNVHDPTCSGETSGGATIISTGGTLPYTYKWSSGETSSFIDDKVAGTYTVTVTDKNGCSKFANVILKVSDKEKPVFNHWKDTLSNRCNLVAISPVVTDNCRIKDLIQLEGIAAGQIFPEGVTRMRYRATDSNNNISEYTYTVTIKNPLQLHVDSVALDTCNNEVRYIQIKMNNTSDYFYKLYFDTALIHHYDTHFTYKNIVHLKTDTLISIRDSFACLADTLLKLPQTGPVITLDSVKVVDASECSNSDGAINLYLKGNSSYIWLINSKGDTLPVNHVKNLSSETYHVLVSTGPLTDLNHCEFVFGPFTVKCTTHTGWLLDQEAPWVYPNPASDELIVRTKSGLKIELLNLSGAVCLQRDIVQGTAYVSINDLENGTYLLIMRGSNFVYRQKVIIQR